MSKKSRLFILLIVLAICFVFLWPSISWYARTPKESQALALSSLEYIKDYSTRKAQDEVLALKTVVKADQTAALTPDLKWLEKQAKKNYSKLGQKAPSSMNLMDALASFSSEKELLDFIEAKYRNEILKNKDHYQNSVKLGLDLSGGMSVIVKADLSVVTVPEGSSADLEAAKTEAMDQAIENLTSRIDRFGLSSPTIRKQGEDRIYIELPGSAEAEQVNSIIQGSAILTFRLVDEASTQDFLKEYMENPLDTLDSKGNLVNPSIIAEGSELLGLYSTDDYGLDQKEGYIVVFNDVVLDASNLKNVTVGTEEYTGRPTVNFTLDSEGARIFAEFTGAHVGERLAIVSDGKVKSAASIKTAITGGQVQITGFNSQEAQNLRKVMNTAAIDVPLSIESQQIIGASLGDIAISQGVKAIFFGLILIMIFMVVWYKGAGFHACVAQVLNLYIMFSILSALNLTITLPMIAGMILTIGMAVDANVIIFERIKEERVLGKDRASAVQAGFGNALWAILDSNITTFIAAIFMSQLGSGPIQGFAYSLAIGVVSTLFTALFASRLIFDFYTEQCHKQNISIGWRVK